jgi:hypothetical protein
MESESEPMNINDNDFPQFARSIPEHMNINDDLPFQEGYMNINNVATATAAAAAATKAAESVYRTKSPIKATRSARRARKYANRARVFANRVLAYFKNVKNRRRAKLEQVRQASREANMAANLADNAAERRRIQEEGNAARAEAVRRSRQEAEEQREIRRQANIAAREAERAAELAREEVERFKIEVANMMQQYQRGELKKRMLYRKIHPNKTRQIRNKAAPNNTYFNNLNEIVKRM